jgi:hypothetical protein
MARVCVEPPHPKSNTNIVDKRIRPSCRLLQRTPDAALRARKHSAFPGAATGM